MINSLQVFGFLKKYENINCVSFCLLFVFPGCCSKLMDDWHDNSERSLTTFEKLNCVKIFEFVD